MGERRLHNLDGLRGVAAGAVLLGHAGSLLGWRSLLPHFNLAVDFFFLLSGYIMARTYQARLDDGRWGDFLWRRFVRLWPLVAAGTAVGLLSALYRGEAGLPLRAFLGIACLPLLAPGALFPLNGPQWSLFFEGVANIVHALFRRGVGSWLIYLPPVVFGAALGVHALTGHSLDGGFTFETLAIGFLRVGFSYSAGVVLWRVKLPDIRLPFPLLALALLAPLALPESLPAGLDVLVILAVWPAVLVLGRADPNRGGTAESALGWLGALSYPIYMLHFPILQAVAHIERSAGLGSRISMVIGVGLTVLAAVGALKLVDEPGRLALSRLRVGRGAARPVAAE